MTQPDPKDATPAETDAAPAQGQSETDWKAEAKKWETRAKENKTAAERLAALEESQKTEQQKLADRLAEAERERDAIRTEALRLRIAADKGLTPKQAARLRGSSEEELLADADELLSEFGTRRPSGDIGQGARTTPEAPSDPKSLADAVIAQRGH